MVKDGDYPGETGLDLLGVSQGGRCRSFSFQNRSPPPSPIGRAFARYQGRSQVKRWATKGRRPRQHPKGTTSRAVFRYPMLTERLVRAGASPRLSQTHRGARDRLKELRNSRPGPVPPRQAGRRGRMFAASSPPPGSIPLSGHFGSTRRHATPMFCPPELRSPGPTQHGTSTRDRGINAHRSWMIPRNKNYLRCSVSSPARWPRTSPFRRFSTI